MRIAFLTRDYSSESDGGLASFHNRLTRLVKDLGHEPEVFVRSAKVVRGEVIDFYGIRVERIAPLSGWPIAFLSWLEQRSRSLRFIEAAYELVGARDLARRLEARHAEKPFDAVHCSAWGATALFVRKRPERRLVTRFCWERDLLSKLDDRPPSLESRILAWCERRAAARSDTVYAPSRFIADHLRERRGIPAIALRPPAYLERSVHLPLDDVPERYLIHFGGIGFPKGSDLIALALPLAWEREPELTMVWAGKEHRGEPLIERYRQAWKNRADQVLWLGELRKASLYWLVSRAIATVLPTRCDNLPNTAIESLLYGVPVIGTNGASIDEIVEPGLDGALVDTGDVEGLADAMVRAWRGEMPFVALPPVFDSMFPTAAASKLIGLLGAEPELIGSDEVKRDPSEFRYTPRLAPPSLKAVRPDQTKTGEKFNVQPDGTSALAVECENAGMFTTIFFGDEPLRTTFGNSSFLSALIPPTLLGKPGQYFVQLRDELAGESNRIEFRVKG